MIILMAESPDCSTGVETPIPVVDFTLSPALTALDFEAALGDSGIFIIISLTGGCDEMDMANTCTCVPLCVYFVLMDLSVVGHHSLNQVA